MKRVIIASKIEDNSIYNLAKRLVKFSQDYDWYDYIDSLEIGETEEDAIESMVDSLSDKKGVQSILNTLNDILSDNSEVDKAATEKLIDDLSSLLQRNTDVSSATDYDVIGKQDWIEVYKADVIKYGGLLNCIKEGEYSVVDENRIRHQANFGHGTMEDYMKHIKSNKNYWIFIDTINQKAYNYNGKIDYSLLDRYRQIYEH